jgi:hypothetical protein
MEPRNLFFNNAENDENETCWSSNNKRHASSTGLSTDDTGTVSKKTKNTKVAPLFKDATTKFKPLPGYERFTQKAAENLQKIVLKNKDTTPTEIEARKRCWQIRCSWKTTKGETGHQTEHTRVILVAGSMPFHGLTKVIAECYEWGEHLHPYKEYETAATKGPIPAGSFWTVDGGIKICAAGIVGTQKAVSKNVGQGVPFFDLKKLKVSDVLRKRGDRTTYHCNVEEGRAQVEIVVQGVEGSPKNPDCTNAWMTPRLVGASSIGINEDDESYCESLLGNSWDEINSRLLGYKTPTRYYMVCGEKPLSDEELEDVFYKAYRLPLFDDDGNFIKKNDLK